MLSFSGCMQTVIKIEPVYELIPESDQNERFRGDETLNYTDAGFSTSVAYRGMDKSCYSLEISVTNQDTCELTIDPADIAFYPVDTLHADTSHISLQALDPEQEIATVEKLLKAADAAYKTATNFNACLGISTIIMNLAAKDDGNKGENVSESVGSWAASQDVENEKHAASKAGLQTELDFWKNDALRATTLNPGETVSGIVLIPSIKGEMGLELEIPVGDLSHVYRFRQVRIK
jgi:hypothetical protein